MFAEPTTVPSGMHAVLDRLPREKAAEVVKNKDLVDVFMSMMGPASAGARQRMEQTEFLTQQLTSIPGILHYYGRLTGASPHQLGSMWKQMVRAIDGSGSMKASFDGGISPVDPSFTGEGFLPPDMAATFQAKYEMMRYISDNLQNPSPVFSQQMMMSAILPIAKQMIPNTIATKAFITDPALGELSKPYVKKRRYKAYQQGLAEEAAGNRPAEIADYEALLVTPTEWKRSTAIDLKWIETMNFDVPADQLSDGGREVQVLIDNACFRGLDALVVNDGAAPAAGSTVNGFKINATQTVMTLEAGLNPQIEHLNYANQLLRNRGYNPDLIITSPFELSSLMSQQAVLMAYAYGTREVQETGLVGTLVGDAVAWTPNLWQNSTASSLVLWVCDSDELARIVLGQPLGLYPDFRQRRLAFELYARLAIFFRNVNSCIKIVCNNADAGIV